MKSKCLSVVLLVSGTSIGTGILALPASTATGGFGYAALTFFICWLFMTFTALCFMEADLWLKGESDLISMSEQLLGHWGKLTTWIIYLLLLYALICTYLLAGTSWFIELSNTTFNFHLDPFIALPLFVIAFGSFVYFGTAAVDRFNRWLMLGLIIAYAVIVITMADHVDLSLLEFRDASTLPLTLPLILTTFGFSIIVPTLTSYLKRDAKALFGSIILGSLVPLVMYLVWEFITLGNIPLTGENSFANILPSHDKGTEVVIALSAIAHNNWVTFSAKIFAIFAVLTSFLGVSLSLYHFLADGLKLPPQGKTGLVLLLITYIPPLLIIAYYPAGFSQILSLAGMFVAILLGIIPVIMVWSGRYRQKQQGFRLPGGKIALLISLLFFVYVVCQEFFNIFALGVH